jgi:hypothetical protein
MENFPEQLEETMHKQEDQNSNEMVEPSSHIPTNHEEVIVGEAKLLEPKKRKKRKAILFGKFQPLFSKKYLK